MVPPTRTVFLSSTGADLKAYRDAAFAAIQKLDGWKCIRMEDFGARDGDVDTFCRESVKKCHLVVCIVGHRFGAGPKGTRDSYTQREYRAAVDSGRPRLIFLAPDDFPIPANLLESMAKIKAQAKFRKDIRDSKDRIVSTGFTSPDNLAQQVVTAIYNFERESAGAAKTDPTAYLRELWAETAHIDIRGLRVSGDQVYQFRIDELYTPLTTLWAADVGRKDLERAQSPVPLQRVLENSRVVLVGDPGAGKTTFLRRIAFAACETLLGRNPLAAVDLIPVKPCPLPVLVRAATLADYIHAHARRQGFPAEPESPKWAALYLGSVAEERDLGLDAEFFREKLKSGCLFLLDGLDEVPGKPEREATARLLEAMARLYDQTHFVAASRPAAYGGKATIPGFHSAQIRELDDEAIDAFAANWCRKVHRDGERAEAHQAELLAAIRSKPEIQAMAVNPVMLTALAALHWNRRRLPDQRAELYDSVLGWLAEAREAKRKESRDDPSLRMPARACLETMQQLALEMHCQPEGRATEFTRHAAARAIESRFNGAAECDRVAAAEAFLLEEETDSGIIISRGDRLRFWHLTFQEYLAARALAARDADRTRLLIEDGKLYRDDWRETVLLLAGVLCMQGTARADEFLKQVLATVGDTLAAEARCVGLVGRILRDLKSWNYRLADEQRYSELRGQVMAIFEKGPSREIDLPVRLEAAEALGQAGDPRLDGDNWVEVKGGAFWMGAQKADPKQPNYDPDAYEDEAPVRRVELKPFLLGRYPVTVQEYAKFIDAGGYGEKRYWTAGGFGTYKEPDDWGKQQRYPNRPVVEVTWYEASAYAAWAGCRLPTEEEWECAARAGREGVRYPWGNQKPDQHRANFGAIDGKGPRQPTPVGMYPEGATPDGLLDLAGNVWEWTTSIMDADKVARGGSWSYFDDWDLRVSFRGRGGPRQRIDYIGFRCLRELLSL